MVLRLFYILILWGWNTDHYCIWIYNHREFIYSIHKNLLHCFICFLYVLFMLFLHDYNGSFLSIYNFWFSSIWFGSMENYHKGKLCVVIVFTKTSCPPFGRHMKKFSIIEVWISLLLVKIILGQKKYFCFVMFFLSIPGISCESSLSVIEDRVFLTGGMRESLPPLAENLLISHSPPPSHLEKSPQ